MAEICPIAELGYWREKSRSQSGLAHALSPVQSASGFVGSQTCGWLIGLDGAHIGEDFRLQDGAITIGSGWSAGIILTAPGLSGTHALVQSTPESSSISDLGGLGGVIVNGQSVRQATLCDGDEVGIGGLRLMYRSARAETSGYRPQFRPRPLGVPVITAVKRRYIAGWLVALTGVHKGQDFRILIGTNAAGNSQGVEISLADTNIKERHLVLQATRDRGIISATETASDVTINGKILTGDRSIGDSDILALNEISFLVKWF